MVKKGARPACLPACLPVSVTVITAHSLPHIRLPTYYTGPGHCYRLYSSAVFVQRLEKFAPPEVLR